MFNGIWLEATEPLTVKGREVKAGERFHISRIHSGALLVTGRATIVRPQPPPKSHEPEPVVAAPRRRGRPRKTEVTAPTEPVTATEIAEPTPQPEPTEPTTAPEPTEAAEATTRRYHRRDLEAEE